MTKKDITIKGAPAYHSYPEGEGKRPGLIVTEEIWGLNDQIKGVVDRFAAKGYSVIAPEILPRELLEKLTPEMLEGLRDPEKKNEYQPKLREAMTPLAQPVYAEQAIATLKACVDYLLADEHVNGNIAVVGFCFGGTYAFHLAAHDERVRAAVPFYGQAPGADEVAKIDVPVLAFYGEQDERLMTQLPQLKEDMHKARKDFQPVVYEGCGHAFFNETNPFAYNKKAADDAWHKTLAFLAQHLNA